MGKEKVPLVIKKTSLDEKPTREELKKITEDIISQETPKYLFTKPLKNKQERIETQTPTNFK